MTVLGPLHPCERDLTCTRCGQVERVAEPQGQTIDPALYVGSCCLRYVEVDLDALEQETDPDAIIKEIKKRLEKED